MAQSQKSRSRIIRRWIDTGAMVVVSIGGLATIFSILGIFIYLFIEVAPLFYSASITESANLEVDPKNFDNVSPQQVGVGIDEYMEVGYVLHAGKISFFHLPSGDPITMDSSLDLAGAPITAVARSGVKGNDYGLGTADGQVIQFLKVARPDRFLKSLLRVG